MKRLIFTVLTILMVSSAIWLLSGCGSNPTGGGGGGRSVPNSGLPLVYVSTTGSDETGTGTSELPYKTIQKGLMKVASGGLVSVEAGIYTENITWCANANVTLRGASYETTSIDGNFSGMCVNIYNTSNVKTATIESFTIMKGHAVNKGGGICLHGNAMTLYLNNCIIKDCSAEGYPNGGGIAIFDWPTLLEATNCKIINNNSDLYYGVGGILCEGILNLSKCEVSGNTGGFGGGVVCLYNGKISNCLITNNIAGGISLFDYYGMSVDVVNCTIASNESQGSYTPGRGVYSYYSLSKIINCIIWGNVSQISVATDNYGDPYGTLTVNNCDVQGGYTGVGNVDADPCFSSGSDFHLTSSSPAIATQGGTQEGCPACDYDGHTRTYPYSMGAYEYD